MEPTRCERPGVFAPKRSPHMGSSSQFPNPATHLFLIKYMIGYIQKGSLPISRIRAHNAKIYGIDWSHEIRNEIVTCSLDKTIKVWDIHASSFEKQYDGACPSTVMHVPKRVIETNYPVWRARDLPFGRGVLSLPQRGETALEMFAYGDGEVTQNSVEVFEGHTDVVKEFVWRKGGKGELSWLILYVFVVSSTDVGHRRWGRVSAYYLVEGSDFEILAC
jgi:WD40 repeat protein